MAILRNEQKDIDGLGPVGIVGEALKLFLTHAKDFILIQVTLMLPLAILLYAFHYYVVTNLRIVLLLNLNHVPHLAGGHSIGVPFHGGPHYEDGPQLDYRDVVSVLIAAVITIVYQAALGLSQAATLWCVGLHYAGRPVSFLDAIKGATPRVWMRLAVTDTILYLIVFSALSLLMMAFALLHLDSDWFNRWRKIIIGLFAVSTFSLVIIFTVASGVSVLEDYGWAAVIKSLKLLKRKVIVAGVLQLLWTVAVDIHYRFEWAVFLQLVTGAGNGYPPWTVTLCVAYIVAFLAYTTVTWQVQTLCAGVQYVSFKTYHDEGLADSIYKTRTAEAGYESIIGDGEQQGPPRRTAGTQ